MIKATLAAVLVTALLRSPSPEREVPRVVRREAGTLTTPLWVSARVAVRDGRLDLSLFDPSSVSSLESLRKTDRRIRAEKGATTEPCVVFGGRRVESFAPRSTFDETVDASRTILAGYVESIDEGFYAGAPGSMLRLRDARVVSGVDGDPRGATVLVYYPSAAIATEAGALCARAFNVATPPRPGDAILVFSAARPVISDGTYILHPDAERELVFGAAGSAAYVPPNLRDRVSDPVSVADVERKVVERLSRSERQR